jgi:hypothetical protein
LQCPTQERDMSTTHKDIISYSLEDKFTQSRENEEKVSNSTTIWTLSNSSDDEFELDEIDEGPSHSVIMPVVKKPIIDVEPTFSLDFENDLASPVNMKSDYKKERRGQRHIQERKSLDESIGTLALYKKYYSTKKQQRHTLTLVGNKFVFTNDNDKRPEGKYTYVVDTKGNLIVSNEENVHHSHLADGKKVKAAGEVIFEKGKLIAIDNYSGHYKPTLLEMMDVLMSLADAVGGSESIMVKDVSHISEGKLNQYRLGDLKAYFEAHESLVGIETIADVTDDIPMQKTPSSDGIDRGYAMIMQRIGMFSTTTTIEDTTLGGRYNLSGDEDTISDVAHEEKPSLSESGKHGFFSPGDDNYYLDGEEIELRLNNHMI